MSDGKKAHYEARMALEDRRVDPANPKDMAGAARIDLTLIHVNALTEEALAMTEGGLDTRASQNAMYFHGRIARLAFGGLAEAEEEGARIALALTDGVSVLLMDNHGVLVVGDSVADAWHQLGGSCDGPAGVLPAGQRTGSGGIRRA